MVFKNLHKFKQIVALRDTYLYLILLMKLQMGSISNLLICLNSFSTYPLPDLPPRGKELNPFPFGGNKKGGLTNIQSVKYINIGF